MMKPNLGHGIYNLFSVQLKNNTENAMSAGMLRAYIQEKNFAAGPRAHEHDLVFGWGAGRVVLRGQLQLRDETAGAADG